MTYRQDKCSAIDRPALRHYGYGEVRSATPKSDRKKANAAVVAISRTLSPQKKPQIAVYARLADLVAGGWTLFVLCVISAVFVFIQNIVGTAGVLAFGMPSAAGVVIGSLALSRGHGTTIAWAPLIATEHDFPAAMETGIAVATLGLIIACVLGGPIAKYLIEKYGLHASSADPVPIELAPEDDEAPIDKMGVMRAMLVVNIAVILGYLVQD